MASQNKDYSHWSDWTQHPAYDPSYQPVAIADLQNDDFLSAPQFAAPHATNGLPPLDYPPAAPYGSSVPNFTLPAPAPAHTTSTLTFKTNTSSTPAAQWAPTPISGTNSYTTTPDTLNHTASTSQNSQASRSMLNNDLDFTAWEEGQRQFSDDFWSQDVVYNLKDGGKVQGRRNNLFRRYPQVELFITTEFQLYVLQKSGMHRLAPGLQQESRMTISPLPVQAPVAKPGMQAMGGQTAAKSEFDLLAASTSFEYAHANDCVKLTIRGDDWALMEKMLSRMAEDYYNDLLVPFNPNPVGYIVTTEQQSQLRQAQNGASNKLTAQLSSSAGRAAVKKQCVKVAHQVVSVNKIGIPQDIYDGFEAMGDAKVNRNFRYTSVICSVRHAEVCAAVRGDKRVALDLSNGKSLTKLALDPAHAVSTKNRDMCSNVTRARTYNAVRNNGSDGVAKTDTTSTKTKTASSKKSANGAGTKKRKPQVGGSTVDLQTPSGFAFAASTPAPLGPSPASLDATPTSLTPAFLPSALITDPTQTYYPNQRINLLTGMPYGMSNDHRRSAAQYDDEEEDGFAEPLPKRTKTAHGDFGDGSGQYGPATDLNHDNFEDYEEFGDPQGFEDWTG